MPLFGFMEQGYRVEIVIALAAEGAAIISLGVMLSFARRVVGSHQHATVA